MVPKADAPAKISKAAENLAKARAVAAAKRSLRETQPDAIAEVGVCEDVNRRCSSTMKKDTPLQAIRAYCTDCMCGSWKEIELCTAPDCPLYPYRFGKRPATVHKQRKAKETPNV